MARSESSSTTTYTFTTSTVSHLWNDLYCVEWDVKLYYTIPSSTVNTWSNSMRPTVKVCRSQWSSCNTVNVIKTFFKTNIKAKIKCSRPRPRLSFLSSRHLETKNLVSRTTSLAVACLTAVCEVLGAKHTLSSCVYRKNHCDLQPWARAVCTVPAVPRSTQPFALHGTANKYWSTFGLSNNNKWRWWL